MPERRWPDGQIEIYEEPDTFGFRIPMLTVQQVLQARRERQDRLSMTADEIEGVDK